MRCLSPRTVGFKSDGKTLAWSSRYYSKEYCTFQIPCGKCIACRLERSRQDAVRCVHEASLYKKNSFITLTYNDENLKSSKLQYVDFQLFVKKLRSYIYEEELKKCFPNVETQEERRSLYRRSTDEFREDFKRRTRVSIFCTGEYGDRRKRPHWHFLLFNWRPSDLSDSHTNERGDEAFKSKSLELLWGQGFVDVGSVTFESASYCARYAAKKLVHGKDGTHDYNPISRRSSKNAIGKGWIERNWRDLFSHGYLVIKIKGRYIQCGIPRYYEKWLKKYHLSEWKRYVTEVKPRIVKEAEEKENLVRLEEKKENFKRRAQMGLQFVPVKTRRESEKIILEQKFDKLQKHLKDL